MTDPLCTCGHASFDHDTDDGETFCYGRDGAGAFTCECRRYAPPGSLEDILGVWRDQGGFGLSRPDAQLLVDEILRLRAVVDVASAWFVACVVGDEDAAADDLRTAINEYQLEKARRVVERADRDHR